MVGKWRFTDFHLNANAALSPPGTRDPDPNSIKVTVVPYLLLSWAISGPPFNPLGAAGTCWSQAWEDRGQGSR